MPPVALRTEPKLGSAPPADHTDQIRDFLALPERTWEKLSEASSTPFPECPLIVQIRAGIPLLCARSQATDRRTIRTNNPALSPDPSPAITRMA